VFVITVFVLRVSELNQFVAIIKRKLGKA